MQKFFAISYQCTIPTFNLAAIGTETSEKPEIEKTILITWKGD